MAKKRSPFPFDPTGRKKPKKGEKSTRSSARRNMDEGGYSETAIAAGEQARSKPCPEKGE